MPADNTNSSILLFDGICNFCNSSVNFVIRHDKKNQFRFAALQSEAGKKLLEKFQQSSASLDSLVLIENDSIYLKSTAALRISKKLNGLYPLLYGFIIIPAFIRDAVYDFISRNRYKWFGSRESCMIPSEDVKSKFIF